MVGWTRTPSRNTTDMSAGAGDGKGPKTVRIAKALEDVLKNKGFVGACEDLRAVRQVREVVEAMSAGDEIAGELILSGLAGIDRHIGDVLARQIAGVVAGALEIGGRNTAGDFPEPDPDNIH